MANTVAYFMTVLSKSDIASITLSPRGAVHDFVFDCERVFVKAVVTLSPRSSCVYISPYCKFHMHGINI